MGVISLFFPHFVERAVGETRVDRVFGLIQAVSYGIIFVLSPLLGAMTDRAGRRMPFLVWSTVICVAATALLGRGSFMFSAVLFIIANAAYQAGLQFYDALLPDVTTEQNRGRVSGIGVGIGYLGSFVAVAHGLRVRRERPTRGRRSSARSSWRSRRPSRCSRFPAFCSFASGHAPRAVRLQLVGDPPFDGRDDRHAAIEPAVSGPGALSHRPRLLHRRDQHRDRLHGPLHDARVGGGRPVVGAGRDATPDRHGHGDPVRRAGRDRLGPRHRCDRPEAHAHRGAVALDGDVRAGRDRSAFSRCRSSGCTSSRASRASRWPAPGRPTGRTCSA